MIRFARRLTAAILCSLFCLTAPFAQSPDSHPWPDLSSEPLYAETKSESTASNYAAEDFAAAHARSDEITAELAAGTGAWSGDYSAPGGEVTSVRFRWAPRSGFVFASIYTCIPSVRRLSHGAARETAYSVDLVPAVALDASKKPGALWRLLKVKWGERQYLIPEEQIGGFCDYVAGLGEYNSEYAFGYDGEFFAKWGEHADPAFEIPVLPPGYERFVKRSIDVAIVAVGRPRVVETEEDWSDYDDLLTPVTVDAGGEVGVRVGMVFHLDGSSGEIVTIRKVGKRTSEGEIRRATPRARAKDRDPALEIDPDYEPIRIGLRATTSIHKHYATRDANEGSRRSGA